MGLESPGHLSCRKQGSVQLVETATASKIGNKWLTQAGVVDGPQDRVAKVLEVVVPEPDGWGYTPNDGRLVLLADKGLWVANATVGGKGDLMSLKIERFDFTSERVRVSFIESFAGNSAGSVPGWRFALTDGPELTFEGADDFGSQLARALDS